MSRAVRIEALPAELLVAVHASPVEAVPLLAPFAALRLGPEEWLCLGATARAVESALGSNALVLDVGDSYAGWRIVGAGARDLLARACALDLDQLAAGAATRTLAAGTHVVLRVLDDGYELRIDRSYADWFDAWLRRL
jgi:heterotetrameric sarcosine oxidase gamma subunit